MLYIGEHWSRNLFLFTIKIICHFSIMDDAAIIAQKTHIKEERKRLLQEDDAFIIQLKELPLTTEEREIKERKQEQEEKARQKAEEKDVKFYRTFLCFAICSGLCLLTGLVLYATGTIIAKSHDSKCDWKGSVFSDISCRNSVHTAGYIFIGIGLVPIIGFVTISMAA